MRAGPESYADAAARLRLYSEVLDDLTRQIKDLMAERIEDANIWAAIKAVYSSLIADSSEWEIAESFFNSLTRRVFATEGVDQSIEFVDTDFDAPPTSSPNDVRRAYSGKALAGTARRSADRSESGRLRGKMLAQFSRSAASRDATDRR